MLNLFCGLLQRCVDVVHHRTESRHYDIKSPTKHFGPWTGNHGDQYRLDQRHQVVARVRQLWVREGAPTYWWYIYHEGEAVRCGEELTLDAALRAADATIEAVYKQ